MKKLLLLLILFANLAFAQVEVKGYTKANGTVVAPYTRSSPNSTVQDNYSYKGNTNPYTGSTGTNYYRNSPSSEYYNGGRTISYSRSTPYEYNTSQYNVASLKVLEKALSEQGFYPGTVDGYVTNQTIKAIKQAQRKYYLSVDGKAGNRTIKKLGLIRN